MRIAFIGSKSIGQVLLNRLILSCGDAVAGIVTPDDQTDGRSELSSFQRIAASHDVPLLINDGWSTIQSHLEQWDVELVIVAGWYRRVPVERMAHVSFYGFHASPLPRYRGGAPLPWQIIRGEKELGLSFFQLTPGLDEGGIVGSAYTEFGVEATIADALEWCNDASIDLLDMHLPRLMDGTAVLAEQDESAATYCGQRIEADGLIDWSQSAERVHDFVRGQTRPYPGAFTYLPGHGPITIWRTETDARPWVGVPGAVVERATGKATVACGRGAVSIFETELRASGSPVPGDELLTSLRIRLGDE